MKSATFLPQTLTNILPLFYLLGRFLRKHCVYLHSPFRTSFVFEAVFTFDAVYYEETIFSYPTQ